MTGDIELYRLSRMRNNFHKFYVIDCEPSRVQSKRARLTLQLNALLNDRRLDLGVRVWRNRDDARARIVRPTELGDVCLQFAIYQYQPSVSIVTE